LCKEPLRVGIVGAGVMGSAYAKALGEYERAELAAVCDLDGVRARELAEPCGAGSFDSVDGMLGGADIEAVVVATPDFAHRDPVVSSLDGGRGVLCEKPLATTEADCGAIAEAVARSGRPFMVNYGNRHRSAAIKMKEALEQGRIGSPEYVYVRLNERLAKTLTIPWLERTSPLWFLMSHCVDLVCWLLDDEFESVFARQSEGGGI